MPRFQGSLRGVEASYHEAHGQLERVKEASKAAIERAHQSYEGSAEASPTRS